MTQAPRILVSGALALFCVIGAGPAGPQGERHLIYLHGRIVQEQQSARPKSEKFGYYELEKILDAYRSKGFAVTGDIRPRTVSESDAADKVVAQVRRLLDSGVPASNITVVGASMGAGIAMVASARLQNPEVRFGILGACLSSNGRRIREAEGKGLSGRILGIREASDESTKGCEPWKNEHGSKTVSVREIVLHTGLDHGFLYRPLPEWVNPTAQWALATMAK
jgi:pimeloyl-ACP methyl ester carboxylesterase